MSQWEAERINGNRLYVVGLTDLGRVRKNNEDNFLIADLDTRIVCEPAQALEFPITDRGTLLLVSDGMGGRNAGEVASQLAVDIFRNELLNRENKQVNSELLAEITKKANWAIWSQAQRNPQEQGMGATLTALLIEENRAHIVQVGDSRAYILRNGKIYRLTKDQSMVQTLIDSGIIQPEDAETHPYRHVILQSLGAEPTVYPVTSTIDLYNGDCLLLCSDGLSNMVKDDMLESIVLQASDLGMCSRLLLESANDLGGNDNITLILADLTYTTVVEEEDAVQVGVPPYPQIIQSTVTGKLTTLTEMQGEEAENYPTPPEEAALPDNALVAAVEDGCLERLLIIDSSPETFNGIEAILKPYYHLITAADGEEGLAKAITEHPRLIIASAELEKIPAINLCYTLKSSERFRHIPLILVSNIYREKMHLIQALSNGADEYLVTPFDRVEVLLRVKSHIEQSRLLKKLRYDSALHEANNIQLQNEMETIAKTRQDIFQNVLDAVSDGMLITDKAGWVTAVNRTFVDFHRISGENIVGFGYRALLRKIQRFYDNPEIQVQRFTDLLNHPETTADDEVKVRHERRGMVAIKRYSAPVRDEDGNIYGRLFIFRNLIS